MKKLKVALIYGGLSQEREISRRTATTMAKNLDPKKYHVTKVEIPNQIGKIKPGFVDVALLAMHGPGGEDGTLQGMLELLDIPYTCSKVLASALAMDKLRTKTVMSAFGMKIAPSVLVEKLDYHNRKRHYLRLIKGKVVIKPNSIGSSLGTYIVKGEREIDRAINKAFRYDDLVLAEKFIEGRELTVPVLGNSEPMALPVIEIVPWKKSDFYDYAAKYQTGGSEHIIPAPISGKQTREVQILALRAHIALGCRGVTRSDFIMSKDGSFYFLEINTIPGMTPTSLVPHSAQTVGISYPKLLDILIKLALQKN